MIKRTVKYIHNLRILFLFFIPFCFFLVLGLNPIDVGQILKAKMGQAVGMSVGVPANSYNKIAVQLADKEEQLDQREAELAKIESTITGNYEQQGTLVVFLSIGIVVLFILVGLNYYMDYRRKKLNHHQRRTL